MCNLNTCLFIVLKNVLRHCTTMECNYFKKPQTSFRGLCSWKQEFLFIFIPSKYLHRGEAMEGNLDSENRTVDWGRSASPPSGEPFPPRKQIGLWDSPLKRNFLQKKKSDPASCSLIPFPPRVGRSGKSEERLKQTGTRWRIGNADVDRMLPLSLIGISLINASVGKWADINSNIVPHQCRTDWFFRESSESGFNIELLHTRCEATLCNELWVVGVCRRPAEAASIRGVLNL